MCSTPCFRAMRQRVKGGVAIGSRNERRESSEKVVPTIQGGAGEI